jgi:hypothetical protein
VFAKIIAKSRQLLGLQPNTTTVLGARPDRPDPRDYIRATAPVPPPDRVDLRQYGRQEPWLQGQVGACHDSLTEVLTNNGWKLFSVVQPGDTLASVDPSTRRLVYERPAKMIAYRYSGDMYYGRHAALDFAVTPDHKMLVRGWDGKAGTLKTDFGLVPMKDLSWYSGLVNKIDYAGANQADYFALPGVEHTRRPQREEKRIPMHTWLRFLGIYLAEGTMLKSKTTKDAYKFQLAACKEREKEFIRGLLKGMGIGFLELPDRFTFQNKQLFSAMSALGMFEIKAPWKFVPRFVFDLPAGQILELLLGHFMGDGCARENGQSHYTTSVQLASDLQTLAILAGKWATVSVRMPRVQRHLVKGRIIRGTFPEYRVSVWASDTLSIDKKKCVTVRHYEGMVYCAEMPTHHTLVTRRGGKVLVSGNCTGCATASMITNLFGRLAPTARWDPSPLFLYYKAREMDGLHFEDGGAHLRSMMKVLQKVGVAPMSVHSTMTDWRQAPSAEAVTVASWLKIRDYQRILVGPDAPLEMMRTLHQEQLPLVIAVQVYANVNSSAVRYYGDIPLPAPGEASVGAHAMMCDGYDAEKQRFYGWNSWGRTWGMGGRFSLPFEYFQRWDLCHDIWSVTPDYW